LRRVKDEYGVDAPENLEFGGVVAVIDGVDCVKESGSRWHFRGSWAGSLPIRVAFHSARAKARLDSLD